MTRSDNRVFLLRKTISASSRVSLKPLPINQKSARSAGLDAKPYRLPSPKAAKSFHETREALTTLSNDKTNCSAAAHDRVEVISIASSTGDSSSSSSPEAVDNLISTRTGTFKDAKQCKEDFIISWNKLFPEIADTYLHFTMLTQNGRIFPSMHRIQRPCACSSPEYRKRNVRCYHFYGFDDRQFLLCAKCHYPLKGGSGFPRTDTVCIKWLIEEGFFPTSPSLALSAYSINMLQFILQIDQRSADSVTVFAHSLKGFYEEKGLPFMEKDGTPIKDPLRRGLGHAMRYFSAFLKIVEPKIQQQCNQPVSCPQPCVDCCLAYRCIES